MYYNIHGLPINSWDFWQYGKNAEGTVGAIVNKTIDSTGRIKAQSGYMVSPIIPYMGVDVTIRPIQNIESGTVFFYRKSGYYTKKTITELLDGDVLHLPYSDCYCMISMVTKGVISITPQKPIRPYDIDGYAVNAFWKNTDYPSNDLTYSEVPSYITATTGRGAKAVVIDVPNTGASSYDIVVSENMDFSSPVCADTITVYQPYYEIQRLKANKLYWLAVNGDVSTFVTGGENRVINVATNGRDIGNKPSCIGGNVKQGLLYRSGRLDTISNAEKLELDALGIKVELDLRQNDSEIEEGYVPYLEYYRVATGDITMVSKGYADTTMANVFRKILECLEAKKPVIFHCRGGADRTGKVAACCLGVLGVSSSDISKDYEMTAFTTNGTVRSDLDDTAHKFGDAILQLQREEGNSIADKWATVLKRAGITDDEIYRFRCIMLTDFQ